MVFISHTTKNHKLALKFADSLSSANVSYWIAPECVDKGKDYVDEIVWAIKRCEYFVLLLSEASQKSSQVRKEVDFAIRYKKKIIPVKLGSCKISERYEYLLADIQIENIANTKNPDFSSIVDKCKLGEKVVTLEITSTPKRNILIMKGDYQDNLDTFIRNDEYNPSTTLFVIGIDASAKLDVSTATGILKYVIVYLQKTHHIEVDDLQSKIDEAKFSQLHRNSEQELSYGESLVVTLPLYNKKVSFLFIANSRNNAALKRSQNIDDVEGVDSRTIILSAFDKCIKEGFESIFIGAMGTNALSFPYEVITAEIINSFIYAKTIGSNLHNLIYSVREVDMLRNDVTVDEIMEYIGTASKFFRQ